MKEIFSFFLVLFVSLSFSFAEEIEIRNGLITTNNVDITADDGSLLSERLQVGDQVFIINNPKDQRQGWVRISKSADDLDGIGWVESKNVRSFSQYKVVNRPDQPKGNSQAKRPPVSTKPAIEVGSKKMVAVAPFVFSKSDDPMGVSAFKAFEDGLRGNSSVSLASAPSRMDGESKASLRLIAKQMKLDGIFTGKLSDPIGGGRLLQIQFYSTDKDDFVAEKTKRIPVGEDPSGIVQKMVSELLSSL